MAVMDNAIKNGYTFAWGSDVSEQGFTRDGIAVMPDAARGAELTGSDMARWTGLTAADKRKELTGKPLPEVNVTHKCVRLLSTTGKQPTTTAWLSTALPKTRTEKNISW